MSAVKHQQSTPLNPMQQFYGTPTPENAVLLAMADHRAHCDPMQPQSEFMRELQKAHERLIAYQKLVEALKNVSGCFELVDAKEITQALLRDLGEAQ